MLVIVKESNLQLDDSIVLHCIPELDKYWAFNIESGDQYTLNHSAFYLLSLFKDIKTVRTALIEFADYFGVNSNVAAEDCLPLLIEYNSLLFFKGAEK